MGVSYLAVLTLLVSPTVHHGAAQDHAVVAASDPDALYRERKRPSSALAAEQIWSGRLAANEGDFESAWKLAKARYWLGTNGPGTPEEKKRWLERGIAAARAATTAKADAVEGYFWLAANMGALADAHGLRQGIKYRGPIKEALEKALALQPSYLDGSPDRALGRWYFKVPGVLGGDDEKAETLIELDKRAEARTVLQAAIDAGPDPDWAPEDARFKVEARRLLASLKH
ncbi:MAG: hypothetical protein KA371_02285 [Acidobacteria bacterium]|nr:hypothetical protein [Acidobacteriota bacterium]